MTILFCRELSSVLLCSEVKTRKPDTNFVLGSNYNICLPYLQFYWTFEQARKNPLWNLCKGLLAILLPVKQKNKISVIPICS